MMRAHCYAAFRTTATLRFARSTRMPDDSLAHSASSARTELILCAALVLVPASYSVYLAFA
jgi:hypothetical protein